MYINITFVAFWVLLCAVLQQLPFTKMLFKVTVISRYSNILANCALISRHLPKAMVSAAYIGAISTGARQENFVLITLVLLLYERTFIKGPISLALNCSALWKVFLSTFHLISFLVFPSHCTKSYFVLHRFTLPTSELFTSSFT